MNIYDLTQYVNLDVDDTFDVTDIVRWFNKGIASFNLVPPLSKYPFAFVGDDSDVVPVAGMYPSHSTSPYVLGDQFMLSIMLPYITASVRSQESSLNEKQLFLQEYMMNARVYKTAINVPEIYMLVAGSASDLPDYQLGEGVYVADMSYNPFRGDWSNVTTALPEFTQETEEE